MKIEIILEIISGICLLLGCIFYLIYNNRSSKNEKFNKAAGIISIILTAIGIGLLVGVSNVKHEPEETFGIETEEVIDDEEIDP